MTTNFVLIEKLNSLHIILMVLQYTVYGYLNKNCLLFLMIYIFVWKLFKLWNYYRTNTYFKHHFLFINPVPYTVSSTNSLILIIIK